MSQPDFLSCCGCKEDETALLKVIEKYRAVPGALLPVLEQAQAIYGYLPEAVLSVIAREFRLSLAEIEETASFYTLLYREKKGTIILRICDSAPCCLDGNGALKEALEKALGIHVGETTADGAYTLISCGCLGACDRAPAVMVNGVIHGPVLPDRIEEWLNHIREEGKDGL